MIVYSDELYHYGVPGMRWGHRKARSLERKYKRLANKATRKWNPQKQYINAFNKYNNAETMNSISEKAVKKRGKKGFKDQDDYIRSIETEMNNLIANEYNKSLAQFYRDSPDIAKADTFARQYDMYSWSDLAKNNKAAREEVERYARKK